MFGILEKDVGKINLHIVLTEMELCKTGMRKTAMLNSFIIIRKLLSLGYVRSFLNN